MSPIALSRLRQLASQSGKSFPQAFARPFKMSLCALLLVSTYSAWAATDVDAAIEDDMSSSSASVKSTKKTSKKKVEKKEGKKVSVKIEGLSGDLEDNAEVFVKSATTGGLTALSSFDRIRVERAVRDALSALGYFHPELNSAWSETETTATLTVKVNQGEPVLIAETNVTIEGPGEKEPFFTRILKDLPAVGSVLNQSDYGSIKSQLLKSAIENGYFQSEYTEHQLGVQLATNKSYWRLNLATGPRFRFGDVTFTGSQIEEPYLRSLIPFKKGEYYTADQFSQLSQNLNETGWFSTVAVVPQTEEANDEHEMPITATLVPYIKNTVDLGVGFSSDGGPHATVDWSRPWINSKGWSLKSSLDLNKSEPEVGVELRIPLEKQPLEHYYTISANYEKTDLNDTESSELDLGVARHWMLDNKWERDIHAHYLINKFTQADVSETVHILYGGIQFQRTRARGGAFAYWGDTQRYSLDVAQKGAASDVSFVRFTFHNVWVRTPWEGHRFVGRATFGWLQTNDFHKIPPDLRFFAGGDRSLRGYDYKSISPTDSQGRLTGAKKTLTASIEYQKHLSGPWWAAGFIDGGEAVNNFTNVRWKVGFGAGIRWVSPIGPIKLDLAFPTDNGGITFKNAHLYFALGTEL